MIQEDCEALQLRVMECIDTILAEFVAPEGLHANVVVQFFEVSKDSLIRSASAFARASRYENKSMQPAIDDYCKRACLAAVDAMDNEPFYPEEKEEVK